MSSNESITGTSHQSCERCPKTTPICRTCSFRFFHGVSPLITHSPLSGVNMPLIIFIVLLLPAPFGPIYPIISPSPIENETFLSACTYVYSFLKSAFSASPNPAFRFATLNVLQMFRNSIIFPPRFYRDKALFYHFRTDLAISRNIFV